MEFFAESLGSQPAGVLCIIIIRSVGPPPRLRCSVGAQEPGRCGLTGESILSLSPG